MESERINGIIINADIHEVIVPGKNPIYLSGRELHALIAIMQGARSWKDLASRISQEDAAAVRKMGREPAMDSVDAEMAKKLKEKLDKKLPGILPQFVGGRKKK